MKSSLFTKLALVVIVALAVNQIPNTLYAEPISPAIDTESVATSQDCMLGEIIMFAGNFAPRNWMDCNGQLISINENSALFSILGTVYGGDGRTSFGLPDLRGRSAIGLGQGPGLVNVRLGEKAGRENVTLTSANLPSHTHDVAVTIKAGQNTNANLRTATGNEDRIRGRTAAPSGPNFVTVNSTGGPDDRTDLTSVTVSNTGDNQAIDIRQPSLGVRYIICMQGTFPSRN